MCQMGSCYISTTASAMPTLLQPLRFSFAASFRLNVYSGCCSVNLNQPPFVHNFKRIAWVIRSSTVDGSGLDDPSFRNGSASTRLIRVIQSLWGNLYAKIERISKNFPIKLLFFLVGFYCATVFVTVIGQTGDWDILSAALAVVVVEGIGALMYRGSLPVLNRIKSFIAMFNYWKAGLALGLFLDSFKYEMENVIEFSLFDLQMDSFSALFDAMPMWLGFPE